MQRHEDPAVQMAYALWADAVLEHADHRGLCQSGCSVFGDACPVGFGNATAEQAAWRAYYDARKAAGVEVPTA